MEYCSWAAAKPAAASTARKVVEYFMVVVKMMMLWIVSGSPLMQQERATVVRKGRNAITWVGRLFGERCLLGSEGDIKNGLIRQRETRINN